MAGDWIKMRVDLAEDPAVIAMACALEISESHVVGLLHRAWGWADKQSQNGHAKSVTLSWLDRYIGVTGFGKSLVDVGWLAVEDGLKFPHFDRHNGESAKKRAAATERKRAERSRHEEVTKLSHNKRDKSATREEKRRSKPPTPASGGFDRFWQAYPRKVAKPAALRAWAKVKPDDLLTERIVRAVQAQSGCEQWVKDGGSFIPHPATWLNNRRWEDEAAAGARGDSGGPDFRQAIG